MNAARIFRRICRRFSGDGLVFTVVKDGMAAILLDLATPEEALKMCEGE